MIQFESFGKVSYSHSIVTTAVYLVSCRRYSKILLKHRDFCRAMLCKRGLRRHAVSVCVSVCLSRSWILSKRINIAFFLHNSTELNWTQLNLFSPSGRHTILVFFTPNGIAILYITGASNARGMKISRFSTDISLYLGNDRIKPWKTNRKPYWSFRMVLVSMTFSEL